MSKSRLQKAATVEALGCTDSKCGCGDVGIILRDNDGNPFAMAILPVEKALDFAEEISREIEATLNNMSDQIETRLN